MQHLIRKNWLTTKKASAHILCVPSPRVPIFRWYLFNQSGEVSKSGLSETCGLGMIEAALACLSNLTPHQTLTLRSDEKMLHKMRTEDLKSLSVFNRACQNKKIKIEVSVFHPGNFNQSDFACFEKTLNGNFPKNHYSSRFKTFNKVSPTS